jgi:hypothetical protein
VPWRRGSNVGVVAVVGEVAAAAAAIDAAKRSESAFRRAAESRDCVHDELLPYALNAWMATVVMTAVCPALLLRTSVPQRKPRFGTTWRTAFVSLDLDQGGTATLSPR